MDYEEIKKILKIFDNSKLSELEVKGWAYSIKVKKKPEILRVNDLEVKTK